MMKIKKITAFTAALALTVSLTACGGDSGSAEVETAETTAAEALETEAETAEVPEETSKAVVQTSGDFEYTYDEALGGVKIEKYIGKDKDITVPAEIDGSPVTEFKVANSKIKSAEIPEGFGKIADYAFTNCPYLESIAIPDGVTEIGEDAFYNCDKLKSVVIPDSVTSIGNGAFGGCSNLEEITIPEGVTELGVTI